MNRRLQQFLELEQLKPAQFADIMGIQRSNVSHILSGRNKPGFEFIQKFLLKFPSVNPDWLILGKGKPMREPNQQLSIQPSSTDSLFRFPADNETASTDTDTDTGQSPDTDDENDTGDTGRTRNVRRITLFYSDGTFQEFSPQR